MAANIQLLFVFSVLVSTISAQGVFWYRNRDGIIPAEAILSGKSIDGNIYVGATEHGDIYIPAMLTNSTRLVYYVYNEVEYQTDLFDVLCLVPGYRSEWISDGLGNVPSNSVRVGSDEFGNPFYVGRVWFDEKPAVGRIEPTTSRAYFPRSGVEEQRRFYDTLTVVPNSSCADEEMP